jgi:hypothetical protein
MPFIGDIAIDTELTDGSFTPTNGIGGGVTMLFWRSSTTITSKKSKIDNANDNSLLLRNLFRINRLSILPLRSLRYHVNGVPLKP